MRLAPVAIRYAGLYPDDLAAFDRGAAESSLPTHASPRCRSACRYLALLLSGMIQGEAHETVLAAVNLGDDADTSGAVCGPIRSGCRERKPDDACFSATWPSGSNRAWPDI